jgi:threonine dehydrogenase-like Zn-dependent dehydrogenase
MKALFIDRPGVTRFGDVADPAPGPDEVLLRVRTLGYCGSDLSTFRGTNPLVNYPLIPGHEIGGTIEAVGIHVPDRLRRGLHVTVSPYTNCGRCPACRRGRINCCRDNETLGVQRHGALAPWLVVTWSKVIDAPGLTLPELALVEPMSIGFHAVARGRVEARDTVAVFGCGMIGLGVIAGVAQRGARAIGVDIDSSKLVVAAAAGAAETINSAEEPLHERLQELTGGDGPDVTIEAVGSTATYQAAVQEVAFAGRVVTIGYATAPVELETKLFVQRELDVLGSRNAFAGDLAAAAEHLAGGAFPVDRVITHRVPFEDAGIALAEWAAAPSQVIKIQVDLEH